ncbi:MAG TPA: metallophosphoesterase [Bacteroidota bacterium]
MFRLTLLVVVLGLQWLVFRKSYRWALEAFPAKPWLRKSIIGLFLLFNLAFIAVLVLRPRVVQFPVWFRAVGMYPFFIWYAATFLLGLLLLAAALLRLPFRIALWGARRFAVLRRQLDRLRSERRFQRFDASRRLFLRRSMQGISVAAFAGSTYGVLVGKEDHQVTSEEFEIAGLDPALDGYTIGLVTDVHSSIFMTRREMDEYVGILNAMRPDLVVVGGDFVNGLTDEVYPFAESFSRLSAPHGAYGVMGNHDFYASDPEKVAAVVNEAGVRLLRNEGTVIRRGAASFRLLGIDDVSTAPRASALMKQALAGLSRSGGPHPEGAGDSARTLRTEPFAPPGPAAGPIILLSHRPYFLPQAADHQVDLMLSGHTHGGQVVFASFGSTVITPASLYSPYVAGPYRYGNTAMYVSRGIGTVGIPVRINCPPEITRIVLRTPRR